MLPVDFLELLHAAKEIKATKRTNTVNFMWMFYQMKLGQNQIRFLQTG